jgi:hypothetical protein
MAVRHCRWSPLSNSLWRACLRPIEPLTGGAAELVRHLHQKRSSRQQTARKSGGRDLIRIVVCGRDLCRPLGPCFSPASILTSVNLLSSIRRTKPAATENLEGAAADRIVPHHQIGARVAVFRDRRCAPLIHVALLRQGGNLGR